MFLLMLMVAALAWWAAWRARHRRLLELAACLPGPPTLPVLGNALAFNTPSEEILDVIGKLTKEYGRVFRFWLGPDLNVCISEPDDVKVLLQSSKTNARGPQYKYMIDFFGYGILSGSGPVWRKRRKLISPNYSNKATESYSSVFDAETDYLLKRLGARPAGIPFNIYEEVVKTTTYTVCQTLFGLSREQTLHLPYLQEIVDETHQIYADAFTRMTTWYLQIEPCYWFSRYYPRHKEFIKKTLHMADAIVKHTMNKMDNKGISKMDVNHNEISETASLSTVEKLILTKSVPKYEEMLKQIFTIFTTSQETSANIASFLLLMMAYHPEYQEKLYSEIRSVFGEADRAVNEDDVRRMPYLDMVLKEVLRLFPIAAMVQRTIAEDIDISNGATLPAGSSLLVPIFHMHRDPDFWPEPDTFDPERFSPERSADRHPYCYIPFSLGPMNCLGRHFGTRLVKTISIQVLRQFRLTSPETYADLKLLCAVSVEAANGYPVILHPLNK